MYCLLVEPDKVLASVYLKQFIDAGLEASVASDAGEAVSKIDAKMPDMIVLEPKLARHSGIELLHEVRSYEDWNNIKIVVYSSVPQYAFGVSEAVWQKYGVLRYLEKSKTSAGQLIGIVKTLMEQA
jgi:ActR/RegA family two-component response regulator